MTLQRIANIKIVACRQPAHGPLPDANAQSYSIVSYRSAINNHPRTGKEARQDLQGFVFLNSKPRGFHSKRELPLLRSGNSDAWSGGGLGGACRLFDVHHHGQPEASHRCAAKSENALEQRPVDEV